jgi:RNA polymerase sigma-70 factor, ECF subfamily
MMTTPDDAELVRRAQGRDGQAFGELVLRHEKFAYNLALRAFGDPQEAQDAAQEAFVRAWQALPGFRGLAGFRTWLYRIVVNTCCNRRPQLRKQMAALPVDEEYDLPEEGSLQAGLEEAEARRVVLRQVEALPPAQQMLVMLRYQQDLSYEEIAAVMGMPLGSVKTGLFRAHTRLRRALLAGGEVEEWTN